MGITDIDDKIIMKCESEGMKTMPEIKKFTEKMEMEFLADMTDLGVQRPDAILRVSEHIPDIIVFVDNLIKGGYAYVSNDGVYFAYTKLPPDHHYDRFGNLGSTTDSTSNPSEADDPSGAAAVVHDKRDSRDFALWKLCREGQKEIGWDSPWGKGRPGWHIECSTMTYQYFGTRLDIHSGGIDLQFPHHANEIAQSECHHRTIDEGKSHHCCYNPNHPWVNHWIHTGHIHIAGRKMSKSLKNFISIRDYLQKGITPHPADDFRLFCLQNKYDSLITYSEERIRDAAVVREKFSSFLALVDMVENKVQQRDAVAATTTTTTSSSRMPSQKPSEEAKTLTKRLHRAQNNVRVYLQNDFHTPAVLQELLELVSAGNVYGGRLLQQAADVTASMEPREPLLSTARYIRNLFGMFGLQFVHQPVTTSTTSATSGEDFDKVVRLLIHLRSSVRQTAVQEMKASKKRTKQSSGASSTDTVEVEQAIRSLCQSVLEATDSTRSQAEAELGLKLDDGHGADTIVRKK
eukprot:gene15819-11321_t